jgi:hypothetical protein
VLLGVGAGFSIADTLDGLTPTEQQTFGVIMMTDGAVNVLGGFSSVFLATPVESTWEIYQSFKGPRAGAPMLPPPAAPPTFGFAPIRDGAMLFSSMRF